ncbi:hypothetical protein G436_0940 [Leptospira interrogans serovar Hardjo str. Norma]|uniref:Uncharacterized protein n=1 Tax=Leptospira interrogans serovar Hardjo str. Norma TaxID=1279460 RepID=A0A0M5L7N7_LEPIR|nr:hypothetical protein G436_0940 [Leptospira interrogans serovar Hardjo str. Norma]
MEIKNTHSKVAIVRFVFSGRFLRGAWDIRFQNRFFHFIKK